MRGGPDGGWGSLTGPWRTNVLRRAKFILYQGRGQKERLLGISEKKETNGGGRKSKLSRHIYVAKSLRFDESQQ